MNRNWFWLAGFPLIKEHGGKYTGTDLAKVENVTGLVDLCREHAMKFYIGGGWFTWHHIWYHCGPKQNSIECGVQYYLDMVKLLPGADGIFLEPAGEGYEADKTVWEKPPRLDGMAKELWKVRPDFEFAVAVGKYNAKEYREALHAIDPKRIYWWWCWGDPIAENALAEHPLVLRWYVPRPNFSAPQRDSAKSQ